MVRIALSLIALFLFSSPSWSQCSGTAKSTASCIGQQAACVGTVTFSATTSACSGTQAAAGCTGTFMLTPPRQGFFSRMFGRGAPRAGCVGGQVFMLVPAQGCSGAAPQSNVPPKSPPPKSSLPEPKDDQARRIRVEVLPSPELVSVARQEGLLVRRLDR